MTDIIYQAPVTQLGSYSQPWSGYEYEPPADGSIEITYTPESAGDKYIEAFFRYVLWNSFVQVLIGGTTGGLWIKYFDGGWNTVSTIAGVLTDGVSATIRITYVGTSIKVYVNTVEQLTGTVDYNLTTAYARVQHGLVTNDIELRWYTAGGVPAIGLQSYNFTIKKTYYMRADGTAANKEAATSDAQASTSMSLATHNSESGLGSCNIVVSDAGGVYRGTLAPKSGDATADTTYIASGSPIFSGAALVSGWTLHAGSVWKATVTTEPQQVWIDGAFGDRKTSIANCVNALDWYWAANVLYLYAASDPDTLYTTPGVEGGSISDVLDVTGLVYATFDGITVEKANHHNVFGYDAQHVTFSNCTLQWAWHSGAGFGKTTHNDYVTFEDCIVRYNAVNGIFSNTSTHLTIRRCEVYENGRHQYANPDWSADHQWTSGLKIWDASNNALFEYNYVHDNGPLVTEDINLGNGIWLDFANATAGNEHVVRYNYIKDNAACGIYCEGNQYSLCYGNLLVDNAKCAQSGVWSVAQMRVDARDGSDGQYNWFYNNTAYGGLYGIICLTTNQVAGTEVKYNRWRNNIVVETTLARLYADTGGDNDGVNGTGNVYNANCFGAQAAGFINWNATAYATYDAWLAASSQLDNNVEVDPSFQDAGSDQYWLKTGSPCIDAGVNLGSPYNVGLGYDSVWPSAVTAVNQSGAWDLGAYPYSNPQGGTGITSRYRHFLRRKRHHGILRERSR